MVVPPDVSTTETDVISAETDGIGLPDAAPDEVGAGTALPLPAEVAGEPVMAAA